MTHEAGDPRRAGDGLGGPRTLLAVNRDMAAFDGVARAAGEVPG